jgi:hypothetical protein
VRADNSGSCAAVEPTVGVQLLRCRLLDCMRAASRAAGDPLLAAALGTGFVTVAAASFSWSDAMSTCLPFNTRALDLCLIVSIFSKAVAVSISSTSSPAMIIYASFLLILQHPLLQLTSRQRMPVALPQLCCHLLQVLTARASFLSAASLREVGAARFANCFGLPANS